MKAAVYYGLGDIRVEEREIPSPGPGELVFQVKACGVCGTDVHIFHGDEGSAEVTPPVILGHEAAGVVYSVGEGVTGFVPGDIVVHDPNELCGACFYCLRGIGHFCTNKKSYGTTFNGAFAQYCCVGAKSCYKVSGKRGFEEYAMGEAVACCLHGIDLCKISPGHNVVIIGGGGIGLLMLQLAKLAGAVQTIVIEPVAAKREAALKLGASGVIDPFNENVKHRLKELGMPEPNTVIECAGLGQTVEMAIDIAGICGMVMLFGLTPPACEVTIKPFVIYQKEIHITASFINPYTIGRAIDIIESGVLDVKSLIANRLPLEGLQGALSDDNLRGEGKIIIIP